MTQAAGLDTSLANHIASDPRIDLHEVLQLIDGGLATQARRAGHGTPA